MQDLLKRKLIFVSGKGGVGKTALSQAIALSLSRQLSPSGGKVLWTTFEDPTQPAGQLRQMGPGLWHLNSESTRAFEEYAALKIGIPLLTQIFLKNKLIRYLSQAAPGLHELVLLGKVWHDRNTYDRVVIDMPSTGYGVAMFQATLNFSRLFKGGGPLQRDALAMLATFRSPRETGQLIVSIPEETPLRESLELREMLFGLFPENEPFLLLNKRFPADPEAIRRQGLPDDWASPYAVSARDFAEKRAAVEAHNLRIWDETGLRYGQLPYLPPAGGRESQESMAARIADAWTTHAALAPAGGAA